MSKRWLEEWPWETVVAINEALCREKNAIHKRTSTGHDNARKLWEDSRLKSISLTHALEVCRHCHQLSPFLFYNGNTFVAIGRTMIQDLMRKLTPAKAHAFRSVIGHYIAGTTGKDELDQVIADL